MTSVSTAFPLELNECHALLLNALAQREGEQAMRMLTQIVERWPELTGKYCGLIGSILYQQGQLDVAARLYRDAVEFDSEDVTARLHLGIVLQRLSRPVEAGVQWAYIAQHHPEQPEAFFQRALAAFFDQKYVLAEQAAQETLSLLTPSHALFEEAHKVISLAQAARRASGETITVPTADGAAY